MIGIQLVFLHLITCVFILPSSLSIVYVNKPLLTILMDRFGLPNDFWLKIMLIVYLTIKNWFGNFLLSFLKQYKGLLITTTTNLVCIFSQNHAFRNKAKCLFVRFDKNL